MGDIYESADESRARIARERIERPFDGWTNDQALTSKLIKLIPKLQHAMSSHNYDNIQSPNEEAINIVNEVKMLCIANQSLVTKFYEVAGVLDPMVLEQRRLNELEKIRLKNRSPEQIKADEEEERARIEASRHTGIWSYHDDDCRCGFFNSYCNRNGYCWSCCGATSEFSSCSHSDSHPTAVTYSTGFKR